MLRATISGIPELGRALARVTATLPSTVETANDRIGPRVIGKAQPKPTSVGQGSGATPKPVADGTVLRLEAGGPWRTAHMDPWGAHWAPRNGPRPYLAQAGEDDMANIEDDYLDAMAHSMHAAGLVFTKAG